MIKKYLLEIVVFTCGAVVMIFELVGSRVLAPHLGGSIYVWTSLIGVMLGALSVGYWLGGKMADKKTDMAVLSSMIFGSAFLIVVMVLFKDLVLAFFSPKVMRVEISALVASVLLFAPTSVLLGAVSPYALRIKLKSLDNSASIAGNLMAISTAGSIIGTFLAGFFIIPFIGSNETLLLIAAMLVVCSIAVFAKKNLKNKVVLLTALLVLTPVNFFINKGSFGEVGSIGVDTQYNRINIFKSLDRRTGKPIVALSTDPFGTQSAMFANSNDLVFEYTKYYRLAKHLAPDLQKSLMIGGCAYSYPKDYLAMFPEAKLDVVEIDPEMTELAKKYFNLRDDPRLKIYHEDGRVFLNRTSEKYDVIFGDAFNSFSSIPQQLTTKEAVQKEYDILNGDGVVILNTISAIDGVKGKFLRAEYATYKSIFQQVYVIPVGGAADSKEDQNIIMVAIKGNKVPEFTSSNPELNSYLGNLWKDPIASDVPILTDNFAPVDYYKFQSI